MTKTYYVHSIFGERCDGTSFSFDIVESISPNTALLVKDDEETEFYTEHHIYFFPGTKKACEEWVESVNTAAEDNGIYGSKDEGEKWINGEKYRVSYDYEKKTKTYWHPKYGKTVEPITKKDENRA